MALFNLITGRTTYLYMVYNPFTKYQQDIPVGSSLFPFPTFETRKESPKSLLPPPKKKGAHSRGHSILNGTHLLGNQTVQTYGHFEGFPL